MIGGSAAPDIGLVRAADAACWFAVWTRSQCEPKVEEALRRRWTRHGWGERAADHG